MGNLERADMQKGKPQSRRVKEREQEPIRKQQERPSQQKEIKKRKKEQKERLNQVNKASDVMMDHVFCPSVEVLLLANVMSSEIVFVIMISVRLHGEVRRI